MSFLRQTLTVAVLAVTFAMSAIAPGFTADKDHDWSNIRFLFLVWTDQSNPFFGVVVKGAMDAAAEQGVKIEVEYGNEDLVKTKNILETSIAAGVSGIATVISDDNAYHDVLCKAMKQGIPVVSYNIDDSRHGAPDSTCRMAFMGQDFVDAGYMLGKRMIDEYGIKKGDLVFTPVEFPAATYAVLRHQGVQKAMDEVGAKTEILGVGGDNAKALDLMTQYLLGHSDVKAVIGLGVVPTSQAVQAAKDAGLNIPVGGFDISKNILAQIASGALTAAVDQQPYSQGFYAVTQLAFNVKYGLYPSDMNTGGHGLVDKTDYESAVKWAGEIR